MAVRGSTDCEKKKKSNSDTMTINFNFKFTIMQANKTSFVHVSSKHWMIHNLNREASTKVTFLAISRI